MRKEFLLLNGVTVNEYMEEATKWLRSMKLGEVLADGRCLASDLTEAEQKELSDYIYEIAYGEMIRTAGKHSLYKCDFGEYSDDLIGNFSEVLMKRLHTFNDKAHLKNDDKKYCFSTFLDELSKDAIRMTYAQKRGVSEHVEQRIQNVRQATRQVMAKTGVKFVEVTPEMIAKELVRYMSVQEIVDILNISTNKVSIEQRDEEDGVEKDTLENAVYIDTDIFDVLDVDVEKLFDAFFSSLTDLEKFFVLVHVGCDMEYYKMTARQLSAAEMLVHIVESDKKFYKQVSVESFVVDRPDRSTRKDVEALYLENVKCVNENLIRYQRRQAKKLLATLNNGLGFSDISGSCGVAYFMHQWELLKEKYQK